jgi:hypothetical protein
VGSAALAVLIVVSAAFLFGVVTVPLGLVLGLPPGLVAIGVFLGSAAFVLVSVPVVVDRVPDRIARPMRRVVRQGPRIARWWDRAGGGRVAGARAAVVIERGSVVLDRLGYRGVAMLAPVLGRWLVPAACVALAAPRTDLYRWALLGCATWAVVGTLGTDVLVHLAQVG